MNTSDDDWITVIDVFRMVGIDPPPAHLSWAIGNRIRDMWVKEHGTLPVKRLARKTSAVGSHMFAHYPPTWLGKIRAEIEKHVAVRTDAQMDLF